MANLLGLGVPTDITGSVDKRDGKLAFVFDRMTNWGGVEVSYAHFDEKQFGGFEPGQRVNGTIVPDLDQQQIIVQRLELAQPKTRRAGVIFGIELGRGS